MSEIPNENNNAADSAADSKNSAKKPFYKRRWGRITLVLLVLVYFCLVPSRLKMTPETTGMTDPVVRDGMVDYYGAYERQYLERLSPPEDNGFCLMLAACGPRILERMALLDTVPWEDIPTHEQYYFRNEWIPLCEHLYIDPYKRPPFLDKREFFSYMGNLKERKKAALVEGEEINDDDPDSNKLWEQLASAPWMPEEYPEVANWLEEYSPVLDYFNMCVRKPNYATWRHKTRGYNSMFSILLPDIQASRGIVRSLRVRINHRIAEGKIEEAWEDIMSILILTRKHLANEPFFVSCLMGIALENEAFEAVRILLGHGNPGAALLDKAAKDLNSLPRSNKLSKIVEYERYATLEFLHLRANRKGGEIAESSSNEILAISFLPIDLNIAGKRINELFGYLDGNYTENDMLMGSNPAVRKKFKEELYQKQIELSANGNLWNYARVPLIRTRSKLLAELFFLELAPGLDAALQVCDVCDARYELLKMAIAVERYQREHGEYPEAAELLVPKYLEIMPLDPCTDSATLTFRRTPQDETPYLIYSFGPNKTDNGGRPEDPATKNHHDFTFRCDDIIFKPVGKSGNE